MKKKVKFIILGLIALAVAGGVIYSMTAPITVPLTAIAAKTAELAFSEQGIAVAEHVIQVYPLAQGQLLSVNVREGQNVREGDIICVIDPAPFYTQISRIQSVIVGHELQMDNLDVEQGRVRDELRTSRDRLTAELHALSAQEHSSNLSVETQNISVDERLRLQDLLIEQSASDLARARGELDRASVLYQAGSMPQFEYEAALDLVAKSESALESVQLERGVIAQGRGVSSSDYYAGAKAAFIAQINGIDQSLAKDYTSVMKAYYQSLIQGSLAEITQLNREIENCTVTAPIHGVITRLNVKSTNFVSSSVPVAEITATGNTVEVYVSTKDVDSIRLGDIVELTLKRREGDVVFTGEVENIGATAVSMLSALGVEERKIKVQINPHTEQLDDASFGVGYEADVKFFVYREDNKLAVPKTALYKDNGKDMLWVVREGIAEAIEVTVGIELRTETVIEYGLQEGDFVVTDANNRALKNGVRVRNE